MIPLCGNKYIVVVVNTDVLDRTTSEIASGSKLGIDATKKLPGESRKLSGLAAADQGG